MNQMGRLDQIQTFHKLVVWMRSSRQPLLQVRGQGMPDAGGTFPRSVSLRLSLNSISASHAPGKACALLNHPSAAAQLKIVRVAVVVSRMSWC